MNRIRPIFLFIIILTSSYSFGIEGVSPRLLQQFNLLEDSLFIRANAVFRDQIKLETLLKNVDGKPRREWRKINLPILKDHAQKTQANVLRELSILEANNQVRNIRVNWVGNEINFECTIRELKNLYDRFPELKSLDWDPDYSIEEITDNTPPSPIEHPRTNTISWGVTDIQAPQIWAQGYTGQGILIANIDTGVERTHPALSSRIWNNVDEIPSNGVDDDLNGYIDDTWGWNFESNNNNPIPGQSHGTNTSGIMVGAYQNDTTGVAIGATLMVLRNSSEGGYRLSQQYAVNNEADVISSSLSYKYPNNPDYEQMRVMTDMELANGLIHANSIGNQGNSLSSYPIPFNIATPGNCPSPWLHPAQTLLGGISSVMAVGAYQATMYAADYTGRGPAAWDSIMSPSRPPLRIDYRDYPYRNGQFQALLKPDVCMPTDVRTTTTGSSYTNLFNGTSAATPHLGGALALLLSAAPDATPMEICEAIKRTTDTTNIGLQHNLYGTGRVRLVPALEYLLSMRASGVVHGLVLDSLTNSPISNAQVSIVSTSNIIQTDSLGNFIFPNVRIGNWDFQFSAPNYLTRTVTNVQVDSADTIQFTVRLASARIQVITSNMTLQLSQGDSLIVPMYIQNQGLDTLRWNVGIVRPDTNSAQDSAWSTFGRIPVSTITSDNRLYGVEFANNQIWVSGGNNSVNPNYLYKLSRTGTLLSTISQPGSTSTNGMRDFAFDGTNFWGSDNNTLYCFDTLGTIITSFPALVNPVRAVTFDPDNQLLYYCDSRTSIYAVTTQGQLVRQIANPRAIWGLGWYRNDPDGMPLYVFSQDSTPARLLSKVDTASGLWMPLTILRAGSDQIAGGLSIVRNWEFGTDAILAISQSLTNSDTLEIIQLSYSHDWITVNPTSGVAVSNEIDTVQIRIRSSEVPVGTWQAGIQVNHNAPQQPVTRIVTLTVTPPSSIHEGDENSLLPASFFVSEIYPNPFNATAQFKVRLPNVGEFNVTLFDRMGRQLYSEKIRVNQTGTHTVQLNKSSLGSGIYFVKIDSDYGTAIRKGVLLK